MAHNICFADPEVDCRVRELAQRLAVLQGKMALFGHQEDERIRRSSDISDIHEATGTFPAVFGFDLAGIERNTGDTGTNIDDHFEQMRAWIRQDYQRGGVITLSWHSRNPITGGGYGDNLYPGSVQSVLPGGSQHNRYITWLDSVAEYIRSLTDEQGHAIPVIFRPYHEHNGDWFWWCIGGQDDDPVEARQRIDNGETRQFGPDADASDEQFVQLWRMTVEYISHKKQVHNILYALSPDRSRMRLPFAQYYEDYMRGYPGDDVVDIFGLDDYIDIGRYDNLGTPDHIFQGFVQALEHLVRVAQQHNKLCALTEVGTPNALAGVPERPWTDFLDKAAQYNDVTKQVLWYLTWTNSWDNEPNIYGTPISSDPTSADFQQFAQSGFIRFLNRIP